VRDGYEGVPLTLARQFTDAGGAVHLESRLLRFGADDPDGLIELELDVRGERRRVAARRLILAMPRRSLELLEPIGPLLDPAQAAVHELIRSVVPIPLFKLAICYPRVWWQEDLTRGRSVTDLPLRQCYYWAVDPASGHAVILIYDDGLDLDYWADLRDASAPRFPHDPALLPGGPSFPAWSEFPAPRRMVEEVHRQLVEMHGRAPDEVPRPYAAAYRDWGEDPFGGGANFWPVGVRSYEVSRAIVQPRPPYRVYVCGDCYSHGQGWVEGALATAEDLLQRHLGLTKPSWKKYGTPAEKEEDR
jgi:monoamine oxidase